MKVNYEKELNEWIGNERLALELLQVASMLQLDKSVELVLFRRKVFDKKMSEIINDHENAAKHSGLAVTLEVVGPLLLAISGSKRLIDYCWVLLAASVYNGMANYF